jgi:hypothetical protein
MYHGCGTYHGNIVLFANADSKSLVDLEAEANTIFQDSVVDGNEQEVI